MNASDPETLGRGRFLRLCRRGRWEWVQRLGASGSVTMVAVTPAGGLLLVAQRREALGRVVLELPAGIAGDEGAESLEAAARRELLEETGYRAGSMRHLAQGPSLPGLTDEVQTFFLATDLERVGPGGGEPGEELGVHELPLAGIRGGLEGVGPLVSPLVYAGLYLAAPFL